MKIRKFNTEYIIIAVILVINLCLHLIADSNSGFHGDELMHIEAGRHLAFGYMDFSPMIALLAYIQNLFQSQSLFVHHLFVHLATALIIIYSGLIVINLGGKGLAVLITLVFITFSPGFGATHNLFLPAVFGQLTWVLCIYYLVKYSNNPENKYLIAIGIFAAIGFLTKYSITFFIIGLFFSVLIFRKNLLEKKSVWISILLFLIIISPNIIWQLRHGFPVFGHFTELYHTQLDNISTFQEIHQLFLFLNPISSLLWVTGLFVVLFIRRFKKYRLVTFTLIFAFLLLLVARGKSYYYFPVILGVVPFGAIFFEQLFDRRKWILITYASLLLISGIMLLPTGLPVLPLNEYVKLYHLKKNSDQKIPIPFENYYSDGIWNQILTIVNSTYENLPAEEKQSCLIWGRHYSEACGINLFGKKMGLPEAFSFHSSCYNWVPDFSKNITVIVISDEEWDKEHWQRFFGKVEEKGVVHNPYASDKSWYIQHVFLCREIKYNSQELKQLFKNEIF